MAATYYLIAKNTLTSNTTTVTFSSIPNTYTDLILKFSTRHNSSANFNDYRLSFNGSSATNYSLARIRVHNSTVSSEETSNATYIGPTQSAQNNDTNTFSNVEIYIPSYTASQNKPLYWYNVAEENSANAHIQSIASLFRDTTAISSIGITQDTGDFASGSSFRLYGIKKS